MGTRHSPSFFLLFGVVYMDYVGYMLCVFEKDLEEILGLYGKASSVVAGVHAKLVIFEEILVDEKIYTIVPVKHEPHGAYGAAVTL